MAPHNYWIFFLIWLITIGSVTFLINKRYEYDGVDLPHLRSLAIILSLLNCAFASVAPFLLRMTGLIIFDFVLYWLSFETILTFIRKKSFTSHDTGKHGLGWHEVRVTTYSGNEALEMGVTKYLRNLVVGQLLNIVFIIIGFTRK